jgi:hypothetical protein
MEKPFDLKDLAERLKKSGMDLLEEEVKLIVKESSLWLKDSLLIHPSPYAKLAIPLVDSIEPELLKMADKIDGKEG